MPRRTSLTRLLPQGTLSRAPHRTPRRRHPTLLPRRSTRSRTLPTPSCVPPRRPRAASPPPPRLPRTASRRLRRQSSRARATSHRRQRTASSARRRRASTPRRRRVTTSRASSARSRWHGRSPMPVAMCKPA
ncbi:hypothetical protein FA09DRAFT_60190 [Tilletiopsis washingtonensis]|uniref:Uncharacterized protein n=1 Tax=Tilletiopsis washingtonensis TaxID=58919 RepID=A0A316Z7X4_9BASI|nr:hypothetical protein FA09DRAFT_60190 [Tilletiopsis washingtonensis]PWN97088.1 hypothetical protein FA09DRAFT_60190 [Tilletiopsis washingtonensis]